MAWIVDFKVKDGKGRKQPTDVTTHVKIFDGIDLDPIVQIDTYGSEDRENPGKQSQTLQFGKVAAAELYTILKKTYNFK